MRALRQSQLLDATRSVFAHYSFTERSPLVLARDAAELAPGALKPR